jgi:hypothetical protein
VWTAARTDISQISGGEYFVCTSDAHFICGAGDVTDVQVSTSSGWFSVFGSGAICTLT